MISKEQLVRDLKRIGIKEGDLLNVKVSLRAIGNIEGGVNILIEALLDVIGEEGTLVCESFIKSFKKNIRYFRRKRISKRDTLSYAGAFTNAMIKHPRALRSSHPTQAFTAIGKCACFLTENFTKDSKPYDFLRTIATLGGKNLKIGDNVVGVGTTHIAICELHFSQRYIPCGVYYEDNGKVKFYEVSWANGCAKGFNMLMPYYYSGMAVLGDNFIGNAHAVLTDMEKTLKIELDLFAKNPEAFFCNDPTCLSCSFTWKHSNYSFWDCFFSCIKNKKLGNCIYAIWVQLFGTWHK